LKLGGKTFNLTLKDIVYDATKGDFHHPRLRVRQEAAI